MSRLGPVLAACLLAAGTAPAFAKPYLEPILEQEPPRSEKERENILGVMFRYLSVPLERGPMFFLPLLDRSKDLGVIMGVMPIWAMRDKGGENIASVWAPSVDYNRYLKTTFTWRQYFFPDEHRLWVARGSYSSSVQRELFLHYYDPDFLKTRYRLNAEFHLFRNPKPSFYGLGPESPRSSEAGYSHFKAGDEITVDIPILGYLYVDATHRYFQMRVDESPIVTKNQLANVFPAEAQAGWKKYMTHGAAFVFDSTDHAALPRRGAYARLSIDESNRHVVSDFDYSLYGVRLKKYFNVADGLFVSAFHAHFQQLTGDRVPFYVLPVVGESSGLRVAGEGRFVDRGKLVVSSEQRFRVSRSPFLRFFSEIEVTPFMDLGTVFSEPKYFRSSLMNIGYGGSLRLVLRPQVVGTVDLVFGREGPNTLIKVGYPF